MVDCPVICIGVCRLNREPAAAGSDFYRLFPFVLDSAVWIIPPTAIGFRRIHP
jgi:hypothetical protein